MSYARIWFRARRKAIIGAAVAAICAYATKHGFGLTGDQVAGVTALLTGISVYLVPNVESGI